LSVVVTFFPHSLAAQETIAPASSVCVADGHVQFICMPAPVVGLPDSRFIATKFRASAEGATVYASGDAAI